MQQTECREQVTAHGISLEEDPDKEAIPAGWDLP